MFDEDFYIDYNRKYIGGPQTGVYYHSVEWITNHYDSIVIEDDYTQPPMTDPNYLAPQCAAFNKENLYRVIKVNSADYPYPIEWNENFSSLGLYNIFYDNNINYPYPTEWNEGVDYQNIQTYFFIQNAYPYPVEWNEPFDPEGIYSPFTLNTIPFHGYPTPKYIEPTYISPPDWVPITSSNIDNEFDVEAEKQLTVQTLEQLNELLKSQRGNLKIRDRDENWHQYNNLIDAYWERKHQN